MKTAVYDCIAAEDYHRDICPEPSLSNSLAGILLSRSPKHAWLAHPRLNPNYKPEESKVFDKGSAAHALLLEGIDLMEVIDPADYPGERGGIPVGFTNKPI